MGRIGEELDIDFVVSTGDNFYDNGLKGEHDPAFIDSFTNIYTAKSLQKQWYTGKYYDSGLFIISIFNRRGMYLLTCSVRLWLV